MRSLLLALSIAVGLLTACQNTQKQKMLANRQDAARVYYDEGDLARAESMARLALEIEPNDPMTLSILGMSLVRVGASVDDANEVVKALNEAIRTFEKAEDSGGDGLFQVQFGHGTARTQRARMYMLRSDRNEKRIGESLGSRPQPLMDELTTPTDIAKELEKIQNDIKSDREHAKLDLEIAESRLVSANAQRPKELACLEMLQTAYALKSKFETSAKWGEEAVAMIGTDRDAWLNLMRRQGIRPEQSDKIQNTIRTLDRQEVNSRSLLALAYTRLGRFHEAILDLDRVLSLDPDRIEDYFNRGVARQDAKDFASAVIDYETFLRRSTLPTDSTMVKDTWDRLGVCRKALAAAAAAEAQNPTKK